MYHAEDPEYRERKRLRNRQKRKRSRQNREKRMAKEEQERIDQELEEMMKEIKPIEEAAAKAAASTEKRPRLISLNMQIFHLYSTDPIKFGPPILGYPTDYIEFYYDLLDKSEDLSLPVEARVDLRMNTACILDHFDQPKYFSTGFQEYQDSNRGVEAFIHFIDDNHLILKVHRRLVYDSGDMPEDAPLVFTYYGIRDKYVIEQKAKQKEEEKKARGRSATPEQPVRRLSITSTCSRDMEYYMY